MPPGLAKWRMQREHDGSEPAPTCSDGSVAFVACTPDDYVAIINLKSLEVTGRLDAGKQPDGMAWSARD